MGLSWLLTGMWYVASCASLQTFDWKGCLRFSMEISSKFLMVFLSLSIVVLISLLYELRPLSPRYQPLPRKFQAPTHKRAPCNNSIDFVGSIPFPDIVLAINFNHPFYRNIPILVRYFVPVFPNYIFCGPEYDAEGGYPIVVIPQP